MAKSFLEQYEQREGAYANAPAPAAEPAPKPGLLERAAQAVGLAKEKASTIAVTPKPGQTYAPSLYDQAAGKNPAPLSFVQQYETRVGTFAGAEKTALENTPEEAKLASMASFLDDASPATRSTAKKLGGILNNGTAALPQLAKPRITPDLQATLDQPDTARSYVQAVKEQQPESLVKTLADGYKEYNARVYGSMASPRTAANLAIGIAGSIDSFLGSVQWLGNRGGPFSKGIAESAGGGAEHLEEWIKAANEAMGPQDFTDKLAQGVGSSAVFFVPGLGVARAGSVLATVSPRIAMYFGGSVSGALEAMSEAGNVYRSVVSEKNAYLSQHSDTRLTPETVDKDASEAATKTFWANAILIALTNRFGVFNPDAAGFVRRVVMSSPIEGVQEAAQQLIQNVSQNAAGEGVEQRDPLEGAGESFLIGAIVGGLMGAGVETAMGERLSVEGDQNVIEAPTGAGPGDDAAAATVQDVPVAAQEPAGTTNQPETDMQSSAPETGRAGQPAQPQEASTQQRELVAPAQTALERMYAPETVTELVTERDTTHASGFHQAMTDIERGLDPKPVAIPDDKVGTVWESVWKEYNRTLERYSALSAEAGQDLRSPASGQKETQTEGEKILASLKGGYMSDREDLRSEGFTGVGATFGMADVLRTPENKPAIAISWLDGALAGFEVHPSLRRKGIATAFLKRLAADRPLPVVDPSENMLGAMRKAGTVTGPDGTGTYTLTLTKRLNDPSQIADDYMKAVIDPALDRGETVVVAGDDMKAHYGKDYDTSRSDMYAKAAYQIVQRLAADPRVDDLVFMGGGPGSGKSEFVGNGIVQEKAANVLYDTTLSNIAGTRDLVMLTRQNGKGLQIAAVLADLKRAWGFTKARAAETGRTVTPEAFVRGHIGFIDTLSSLIEEGTLDPKQVLLYDLRKVDAQEARAIVEEGKVVEDPLATLQAISYTQDYVQGITAAEGAQGDLGPEGGRGSSGVSREGTASREAGAEDVLILKPEDLDKTHEIILEDLAAKGTIISPAVSETAKKLAKKNVRIGTKYEPRPEQIVKKAGMRDVLAALKKDVVDFTVADRDGTKYLSYQDGKTLMRLKADALGLISDNLEAGKVVRVSAQELKEKGTALRVHGSGGALAFNIKNLAAGADSAVFTEETDKIVKRSEIAENLAKELGVPVRTGNFKERALGIFKPWAHVIRLKGKLGNMRIPVLVHESAHYIDYTMLGKPTKTKQGKSWVSTKFVSDMIPRHELDPLLTEYGGQPRSKKREAFAEFVRYWVTEPSKARERAPEFTAIWEDQILPDFPEVRDVLLTTRRDWERWNRMPAVSKIVSQISFGEKTTLADAQDAIVRTWHDTLTGWIDDLHPIKRFSDLMKEKGAQFDMADDPYVLARLTRGWVGKANTFLERGTFSVKFWSMKDGKAEPAFTGKGFKEIIDPIAKKGAAEDFAAYLVSRRAIALNERGVHSGFDTKVAKDALAELAKAHPEFAAAASELDAYQDALLDYAYQSGLIRPESHELMKETLRDYVPFYRVMEEGDRKGFGGRTFADIASPIKRMKGSDRDVINPLESIVKNTYAIINASERNRVGMSMINLSSKHPAGQQLFEKVPEQQTKVASVRINELIEQVSGLLDPRGGMAQGALGDLGEQVVNIFRPSFIHGDNILTVMVGGKPQSYYVDSEIYRAMQGLDVEDVGFVWKMLSYPSRWLRAGATLTPEFMVRNPSRDMLSAYVYSEYGFMPPIDAARGLYGALTKDNAYWLWRMGGGEQAMLVSMDRTTLKKSYEELTEEHSLTTLPGVINVAKKYANPLEDLRLFSEFSERMTRIGEAKKAIERGANPLEAAFTAREVTLDFAKMGAKARAVNMVVAFFNAQVQGSVRMARAFTEHPFRTTTKTLIGITLPSVLLALWNAQEPDWEEIPQWQKNLFWLVKVNGVWLRFPKPFELGILFGSIPERIIESIQYDDPNVWPELRKSVIDGASPSLLPTGIMPIIENTTNYSFFLDRNLVPDSAEGLPPFAQYTSYTSGTAREIGKWLSYSPAKIDNLIQGYFGGLGRYATSMIDKFTQEITGNKAQAAPAPALADVPVVKAFVVRDPVSSSSESLNRFYLKAEQALSAKAYYNDLIQKGDMAAAKQWYADHMAEISLSSYYETTRKNIASLRRLQNMARDSAELTPEKKREKVDQLGALMTDIAHKAIEMKLAN